MALVHVEWYRTETFVAEIEVDGFDPAADDADEQLLDVINEMDQETLTSHFDGCTELDVTLKQVVRAGELAPEIAPRKQTEDMF